MTGVAPTALSSAIRAQSAELSPRRLQAWLDLEEHETQWLASEFLAVLTEGHFSEPEKVAATASEESLRASFAAMLGTSRCCQLFSATLPGSVLVLSCSRLRLGRARS